MSVFRKPGRLTNSLLEIIPIKRLDFIGSTIAYIQKGTERKLLITGEKGDGGIFELPLLERKHNLPSWSTVVDFQCVDIYNEHQDSLFLACDTSVKVLRNGIKATKLVSTDAEYLGCGSLILLLY